MKLLKIAAIILILGVVVFQSLGCSSDSDSTATIKTQIATVQKGSLSVAITGTGNLALSQTEDLAFEIAGYVEEILVNEGATVKKGQEVAKLDTSEWDKQLKTLEKALATAERNLTSKESALTSAERQVITKESALAKAERLVTTKEFAVRQAQVDVQTAEYNLSQIDDVKEAQDAVDDAESTIKFVKMIRMGEFGGGLQSSDFSYWSQLADLAQVELTAAQEELDEILDGSSVQVTTDVALQVVAKQILVEKSQMALEDAQTAVADANQAVKNAQLDVDDAKQAVKNAQLDVDDAKQTVKDAQSDLDEAKSLSPIIKAPFDGFIAKINVEGGDEVQKGTVAMQLADPNQFAAKILVTEEDVFSVKMGGDATVSLTALSDLSFPAKVTKISPTASVSSGVVNYAVTVNITSLQPVTASLNTAIQPPTATPGSTSSDTSAGTGSSQNMTLKDGLSATVNIISQHKDNILTIPSKAITRQGQNSTVQVVKGTGTETRVVKTGMTDGTSTEITEGLSAHRLPMDSCCSHPIPASS